MIKEWCRVGRVWGGVLLWVLAQAMSVSVQASSAPTRAESMAATSAQLVEVPVSEPEMTARLSPPSNADAALPVQLAPTPTITPTTAPRPLPNDTPTLSGAAHIAVLVSEAVIPVSGTASSEVFVSIRDAQPGVRGFTLIVAFDPQVVQVRDTDSSTTNGIQVAAAEFFDGAQKVEANQADNVAGEIILTITQDGSAPMSNTDAWEKVATVRWTGKKEGKSVVSVSSASRFQIADGGSVPPDAAHDGVVFVRAPGIIEGIVKLQGRENHQGVDISTSLAAAHADRGDTDQDGRFAIPTSQGEGFYALQASMPGYLSAESDRPVKVTVGKVVDMGAITLIGGDVNNDNRIDILDLSYVAYRFNEVDANADANGDGVVDILDLSLTAGNFGKSGPIIWEVPGLEP
jgi:hypothetical protein